MRRTLSHFSLLLIAGLISLNSNAQKSFTLKELNPKKEASQKEQPAKQQTKGGTTISIPLKGVRKEKGTIFFDKTHLNLDILEEHGGIKYVLFSFANIGKGELRVLEVKSSCGCTTPEWSKAPLKQNETGFIKVGYSPEGQAGHFSRSLTVTTDGDPEVVYLIISGEVRGSTSEWHQKTPVKQGNTRTSSNVITFDKVTDGKRDSVLFYFFNSADKEIDIIRITAPPHLLVQPMRKYLPAHTGTNVWITFLPNAGAQYGPNDDELLFATTDDTLPMKRYMVKAHMVEDFSALPEKERKKPPVIKVAQSVKDFGEVYLSEVVKHDFEIENKGKSDLVIRRAYASCGCTVASIPSSPVKKGGKAKISVTLNTKSYSGLMDKDIHVISNDPKNPEIILKVRANVIDPSRTR
jgi:hypothetical protein